MIKKRKSVFLLIATSFLSSSFASYGYSTEEHVSHHSVNDEMIEKQRAALASNMEGAGFGPQSPRDIEIVNGDNNVSFALSPAREKMNLCNIHFHENAEHKGGEFTTYAGNGNGAGFGTGYKYNGHLSKTELKPIDYKVGATDHGELIPGDTIEVHYVFSSAQIVPGPTLGACLNEAIKNPQLRVEAQVYVLVNDAFAADFMELTDVEMFNGMYQAPNIPTHTGTPVQYTGSTTGPSYNEKGSPFQVTWNVRPHVMKVNIHSVAKWFKENPFNEDHAHGVRNLVTNAALLSEIK